MGYDFKKKFSENDQKLDYFVNMKQCKMINRTL